LAGPCGAALFADRPPSAASSDFAHVRGPRSRRQQDLLQIRCDRIYAPHALAAVVVEARYSALYKLEHVNGSWLADQLARLEVRYPEVDLVFADSRRYAEEWTYRLLTTALADATDPNPNG
jgi:hypothetical protein